MSAEIMTAAERTAWLAWRKGGITATDAAKVVGLSPWGSPWTVWADKVGLVDADTADVTDAMEFGKRAEPMMAAWFTDRTGYAVTGQQQMLEHPHEAWARATIDGYATDPATGTVVAGIEIKTTSDPVEEWKAQVPLYYQCQAQWQMYVTGCTRTYFPTLHLAFGRLKFEVHEVLRDEDDIAALRTAAGALWQQVTTGTAPDVDDRAATAVVLDAAWPGLADDALEADDALVADVANLVALKADLAHLEDAIILAENRIKATLADRTTITHGTDAKGNPMVLLTWKPQERTGFDHKAALERYPRALERYITTTTHRVLRPKKPKSTTTNKEK